MYARQVPVVDAASVAARGLEPPRATRRWAGVAAVAALVAVVGLTLARPGPQAVRPPETPAAGEANVDPQPFNTVPPAERTFAFEAVRLATDGSALRDARQARSYAEDLGNGVAIEMVAIPAGTFTMGSTGADYPDEGPQHAVTLAGFYLSRYEVTQSQWRAVAAGLPKVSRKLDPDPSATKGDDLPVEQVSWEDAMEFSERLSQRTRHAYHLPSEAEWEYAARAGTTTAFAFGDALAPTLASYDASVPFGNGPRGAAPSKPSPVGSFGVANAFGISDMHGNVAEWCLGEYHPSYEGTPTDGRPWITGGDTDRHVLRGGSWRDLAVDCRSANRYSYPREGRQGTIGFRLAMSLPAEASRARVASAAGEAPLPAVESAAAAANGGGPPLIPRPGVDRRAPRWTERPAAARVLRRGRPRE
jgi:formylglycine-generating enzyme required for sulfatase activity